MIKTVTKKYAKQITLSIAFMLVSVTLFALAGCSSAKEPEPNEEAKASTKKVTETKVEEKVEEVAEPTPEPTAEPTPDPTPEPVVYEGIDMESTLPAAEWVLTFDGIINEPKMVIFNDATNKKVIVEQEQKAEIAQGDSLGIYIPNAEIVLAPEVDYKNFTKIDPSNKRMLILSNVSPEFDVGDTFVTTNVLEYDGVEVTLTARLTLTE